jgi:hypothetical protein
MTFRPLIALCVAAGLALPMIASAGGPTGSKSAPSSVRPLVMPAPKAPDASRHCNAFSDPYNLNISFNAAGQVAHTGGDFCTDFNLSGTVTKATKRKVVAGPMAGSTGDTNCCEQMNLTSFTWSKRKGTGKMVWSFVCSGSPTGDFVVNGTDITCN